MNIGMILDNEFNNDKRVLNEAAALTEAGFNVYVLCFDWGNHDSDELNGVKISRIKASKKISFKMRALTNTVFDYYTSYWAKRIIDFVQKNNIDVIHVHDLYMIGSVLKAKKKIRRKIKIVGDLHENYVAGLQGYRFSTTFPGNILISINKWKKTEKKWISSLDYAITVVEEMKNRISAYIDPEKIYIYENLVKISDFTHYKIDKSVEDKYKNKFVLSYVGGFDYHRGLHTVIDSLKFLKDLSDLKLCLVGSGKNINELKQQAEENKVLHLIEWEGWQKYERLPNYFYNSDIGLIPHLKSVQTDNSSPNKLFQYMLTEVPVIVANCNSIQRVLEETESGLIFSSNNPVELAERIRYLYNHPEERKKLGANGKKAVLEKYNYSKTKENLINLYKKISSELV